jgi:hypothetical protein
MCLTHVSWSLHDAVDETLLRAFNYWRLLEAIRQLLPGGDFLCEDGGRLPRYLRFTAKRLINEEKIIVLRCGCKSQNALACVLSTGLARRNELDIALVFTAYNGGWSACERPFVVDSTRQFQENVTAAVRARCPGVAIPLLPQAPLKATFTIKGLDETMEKALRKLNIPDKFWLKGIDHMISGTRPKERIEDFVAETYELTSNSSNKIKALDEKKRLRDDFFVALKQAVALLAAKKIKPVFQWCFGNKDHPLQLLLPLCLRKGATFDNHWTVDVVAVLAFCSQNKWDATERNYFVPITILPTEYALNNARLVSRDVPTAWSNAPMSGAPPLSRTIQQFLDNAIYNSRRAANN